MMPQHGVPLPQNILPHIDTTLAFDNIDRLEKTLSGSATSHRVNGIAVQTPTQGPMPKPFIPHPLSHQCIPNASMPSMQWLLIAREVDHAAT